ncbi:MAG: hypothetical protein ACYDCL_08380 [Myxococcales bacterium]
MPAERPFTLPALVAAAVDRASRALGKSHVRFALFGATALRLRGVKRETEDVDFLLRSDQRTVARRLLRASGFDVAASPDRSQLRLRDAETGVRVDLLFAGGEPYDTVRAEAERLEIAPGVVAPVARAEGLLLAYLLSDQPRHEDDGIRLIRRKLVDLRRVQSWLWDEGDRGSLLRLRGWIERARRPEGGLLRPRPSR